MDYATAMISQSVPACQIRRLPDQVSILWASMHATFLVQAQQIALRSVITVRAVVHSQDEHESRGCRGNIWRRRRSNRRGATAVSCTAIRLHRRPRFQGPVLACRPCSSYKMPRRARHSCCCPARLQAKPAPAPVPAPDPDVHIHNPATAAAARVDLSVRRGYNYHEAHLGLLAFASLALLDTHSSSWACLTNTTHRPFASSFPSPLLPCCISVLPLPSTDTC
jgi:hypothetical protein